MFKDTKVFDVEFSGDYQVVNVIISTLGCPPYTRAVDLSSNKTAFLSVNISNCTNELAEIVVSAKRKNIRENGDTLTFDVKGFIKDTDLTLGDLLSRMPGIEITSGNQILYQGKRIQQIWVQGYDILNNQHSLALEGIKAEDVKEVQIVRDYRPFHLRFSQQTTGQTAMNVKFKKGAKNRVNGSAELSAGGPSKFAAEAEAIVVGSNAGSAVFARSNNTGVPLLSTTEYLGMVNDMYRLLKGHYSGELNILPPALQPSSGTGEVTQYLASGSRDVTLGKNTKAKLSVLGFLKNLQRLAEVSTEFFDANRQFTGRLSAKERLPLLSIDFNLRHEINKDMLLEISLPVEWSNQNSNTGRRGSLDAFAYTSRFVSRIGNFRYDPRLRVSLQHSGKWNSQHEIGFGGKYREIEKKFSESAEGAFGTNQRYTDQQNNLVQFSELEFTHRKLQLRFNNRLEFGNFTTKITESDLAIQSDPISRYGRLKWGVGAAIRIKSERISTQLEVRHELERISLMESRFTTGAINPIFRFKYTWRRSKFIGFSVREQRGYIDQQYAFNVFFLDDVLQLNAYGLEAGQRGRLRLVDAYYADLNTGNLSSVTVNFQYQSETNALTFVSGINDDVILSQAYLAEDLTQLRANLSAKLPFGNSKYQVKPRVRFRYTRIDRQPFGSIDEKKIAVGANVESAWSGYFNLSLGVNCVRSTLTQELFGRTISSYQTTFGGKYDREPWRIETDYLLNRSEIGSVFRNIHQLNFTVSYRLAPRWAVTMKGIDVLNLNDSGGLDLRRTATFIEQQRFARLRGALLIGTKYTF